MLTLPLRLLSFTPAWVKPQSVLDNIVMAHPVGATIVDPTSLRVRLLLAGHHIDAAIWELARS